MHYRRVKGSISKAQVLLHVLLLKEQESIVHSVYITKLEPFRKGISAAFISPGLATQTMNQCLFYSILCLKDECHTRLLLSCTIFLLCVSWACAARCEECGITNDLQDPHNTFWKDSTKCGQLIFLRK